MFQPKPLAPTPVNAAECAEFALAEAIPQLVWTTGPDGMVDFVNQKWVRTTGLSLEQSRGTGWTAALHPNDVGRAEAAWEQAVAAGEPYEVEYRLRQLDGTYRWYLARGVPVRDRQGAIARWLGTSTDVTDRELQESEERFKATFEQAAVGLAHVAPNGHWIRVNQRLCDILGYSRDELRRLTFQDLTHPDDVGTGLKQARRLLAGEIATYALEKRYIRKDGQSVWCNLTVSLVRGPQSEPKYFIVVVEDISSRKQVEMSLRDITAKLHLFIEHAPAAIAMVDRQMRYIAVSRQWLLDYRLTGDVIGQSHYDLFPEIPARWRDVHHLGLAGETLHSEGERFERNDGTVQWVKWDVLPWRTPDERVGGIIIATEDITAKRKAGDDLRESEARFRTLADNIAQLAWMADATGCVFWYNQRWFDYTGTTLEQMQGWGWQAVLHPDHVEAMTAKFRRHLESGEPWEDTFPMRGKDGAYRWFLAQVVPVRDEAGHVVRWFGTDTDVTGQHEAQEALREAVKIREDFLSIASHELRTPLTSLELQLDRIFRRHAQDQGQYPLPVWLAPILTALDRQAKRLEALVVEMLDFSRITSRGLQLTYEEVDLREVVDEVADRFKIGLEHAGCDLTIQAAGPVVGHWDRSRLDQVVTNLLSNAIKYGAGAPITITLERSGTTGRLTVRDRGVGIAPEDQARIFGQFERLVSVRHYGGFGLGLWITRQIVDAMGGTIAVASALGEGAAFTVTLPLGNGCARP